MRGHQLTSAFDRFDTHYFPVLKALEVEPCVCVFMDSIKYSFSYESLSVDIFSEVHASEM